MLQEIADTFLKSNDPDSRQFGIAMRIRQNDLSSLDLLEKPPGGLDSRRLQALYRWFGDNFSRVDTLGVKAVVRLHDGTQDEILREACIRILHRAHTRAALPTLAKALDSPNPQIRGTAVRGLAGFANNIPPGGTHQMTPGPWRYKTEETVAKGGGDILKLARPESIEFWRAWWERYKKELTEQ